MMPNYWDNHVENGNGFMWFIMCLAVFGVLLLLGAWLWQQIRRK